MALAAVELADRLMLAVFGIMLKGLWKRGKGAEDEGEEEEGKK
jgi:hypothetical protein